MENTSKLLEGVKNMNEQLFGVKTDMDKKNAEFEAKANENSSKVVELEAKLNAATLEVKSIKEAFENLITEQKRPAYGTVETKSIGQTVFESSAFKEWKGKNPSSNSVGQSHSIPVGDIIAMERKALTGNANLRSVFSTDYQQVIYNDPMRPNHVRDLIPVHPTQDQAIKWARETSLQIGASMVKEGLLKPESSISFDTVITFISTLATWIRIPRQLLDDVKTLASYVQDRLTHGLKIVEDYQILYGDGNGENMLGILNTPGIQNYVWSAGTHGDTQIDAIRRAMTLAELAYYPVDGIVMNPIDWERIELTKSTTNLYVFVNVQSGATPTLWGARVVTTTALNQGQVLLGAFGTACALWDREEANVRVGDQDRDNMVTNMVTMLLEERIGFSLFMPKAMVLVTLDAPPA